MIIVAKVWGTKLGLVWFGNMISVIILNLSIRFHIVRDEAQQFCFSDVIRILLVLHTHTKKSVHFIMLRGTFRYEDQETKGVHHMPLVVVR